jgi:hypothetical protein
MTRGIITIALGTETYLRMAKDLALSARKHCGTTPRAVVTDSSDAELAALFDIVIPVDTSLGDPLFQKLCLDKYSPFDETLFIDCDSLIVGDVDFIWRACEGRSSTFVGQKQTTGSWYGADVATICKACHVEWLGTLNSGMIYFRSGEAASKMFDSGRRAQRRCRELGFDLFRGNTYSDEIGFSIAFGEHAVEPLDDPDGLTMRTPIGIEGKMQIDVLRGYCRFVKRGQPVAPTVVHFATWQFHPTYYRERAKLRLYYKSPLIRPLARVGGTYIYWRERSLGAWRSVSTRLSRRSP